MRDLYARELLAVLVSGFTGGIMRVVARPEPGEYAPYTVEYFDLVPGDDVLQHMETCLQTTPAFFKALPEEVLTNPHQHHLVSIGTNYGELAR